MLPRNNSESGIRNCGGGPRRLSAIRASACTQGETALHRFFLGILCLLLCRGPAVLSSSSSQICSRCFLQQKLLASLEEIQVSNWLRNDVPGLSALEVEKLELILRSVRSLRLVLGDFMHDVLVPALVKLAESLISPTQDVPDGVSTTRTNSTVIDVAVVTLQTLSVLLECDSGSVSTRSIVVSWGEHNSAALPSCSSLLARAAQSLIRMLGKEANAGRVVGFAIVETLCVCAKQLGDRWLQLHGDVARDTIFSWHLRVELLVPELNDTDAEAWEPGQASRPLAGLLLYDEVVREFDTSCLRRMGSATGMVTAHTHPCYKHVRGRIRFSGLFFFSVSTQS